MSEEHMTILCRKCGEPFEQTDNGSWRHTCTQGKVSVTVDGYLAEKDILPPEAMRRMIAKEETPGTQVETGFVYFGDGSLERVTIPEGSSVMPFKHIRCDGPACQSETLTLSPPAGWRTVTGPYHIPAYEAHNFCSLRCLANWLAGELAKEENK